MHTARQSDPLVSGVPGGTVESALHSPAPPHRPPAPQQAASERYELRDRATQVVHRANSFFEMAAKAEEIGSGLFVAVAQDGKRTSIEKVDGLWRRGPQRPAPSVSPAPPSATREPSPAPVQAARTAPAAQQELPLHDDAKARAHSKDEPGSERASYVAGLEAALRERYTVHRAPVTVGDVTIGRIEYRFRGDGMRVAFTESTFRLTTDNNHPSVARSMVDVAEARGWQALRVSGHEDFKRRVWFEATLRGLKALGYEPSQDDLQQLRREREARQVNRVEPVAQPDDASIPGAKTPARGRGGRNTVLAAIEAVLVAKKVPEGQREAVMAAAAENLTQRIHEGREPRIKVYDRTAREPQPSATPASAPTRPIERSGPSPQR